MLMESVFHFSVDSTKFSVEFTNRFQHFIRTTFTWLAALGRERIFNHIKCNRHKPRVSGGVLFFIFLLLLLLILPSSICLLRSIPVVFGKINFMFPKFFSFPILMTIILNDTAKKNFTSQQLTAVTKVYSLIYT